jgi:DDE superfamily endonuclease
MDVLAATAPGLRGALLAAPAAGHAHVTVDGTLIRIGCCAAPGPTARADHADRRVNLWWSGKHAAYGGNVQVITAPAGWPLWTSGVRPGRERDTTARREHETTALRAHAEALPALAEWTDAEHANLANLGYEGERTTLTKRSGYTTHRGEALSRMRSWLTLYAKRCED